MCLGPLMTEFFILSCIGMAKLCNRRYQVNYSSQLHVNTLTSTAFNLKSGCSQLHKYNTEIHVQTLKTSAAILFSPFGAIQHRENHKLKMVDGHCAQRFTSKHSLLMLRHFRLQNYLVFDQHLEVRL